MDTTRELNVGEQLDLLLESTMDSVTEAGHLALRAARRLGLSPDDQHRIRLAVHESVLNAVSHGNRFSRRKSVRFRICCHDHRLVFEIEDEGDGFSLEQVPDPVARENLLLGSGRGLFIIRGLMDEINVTKKEPCGTRMQLIKWLPGKE